MKTMRYSIVLASALLLAGCTTNFRPWNLSAVTEGMERDQVVQLLGPPDFVENKDGTEYLHYTYREDYNPASIYIPAGQDNDRAFRDLDSEKPFQEYEYVVILTDGKVINYKEL